MLPLTVDHRIDTNLREQQRVTASGGLITNVDRSGAARALQSQSCACAISPRWCES